MNFFCSELILITLIKKTSTTFLNLRGVFICFILRDTILSLKVCFDTITLGKKLSYYKATCARTRHCYDMPILYVFLMSSYILKMLLLAMLGKLVIVLLESSLCFETAVKEFETS